MKMIEQWTKIHTYSFAGIIVALLVIYIISYLSIIKPIQADVESLNKEVSRYEAQYEKIVNQSDNNTIDEQLSSVALQLPTEKSPDTVLVNIQNIAEFSNVTIDYIESGIQVKNQQVEEESSSDINKTMYLIDASTSSTANINIFLDKIRRSERLLYIDTINIRQEADQVYLTITIQTYYTG